LYNTPQKLGQTTYVPFSKAGSELLFEVVSRAYERQSLIVTTNLPFEKWTEVCGSERLTGALLDRLTHRVHIIEANGASYRLEQSRKRLARRKKRAGQAGLPHLIFLVHPVNAYIDGNRHAKQPRVS